MRNFWKQHWFLTTLSFLLVTGLSVGLLGGAEEAGRYLGWLKPRTVTAGVLLLMSFSLDSGKLWAAFRSPFPVLLGCLLNYGLVPALAWCLMPAQWVPDLRLGLMIAATVPCTTAAASVMTRKAGGNDAISLLVTLATNLSCFLLTPLWLRWTTSTTVPLDLKEMMLDLLVAVLLPTAAGQLLRAIPPLGQFATRYKTEISTCAQVLIELMVLTAALRAGDKLHDWLHSAETPQGSPISVASLLVALVSCAGLHLVVLVTGWWLAGRAGLPVGAQRAVAFAGSQKTLPIGLYIATNPLTFGTTHPFAMFPMLLYHTSQLFLDTAIASAWARGDAAAAQGQHQSGQNPPGPMPPSSGLAPGSLTTAAQVERGQPGEPTQTR
jgi:sodium/bile acid cotransporter 7